MPQYAVLMREDDDSWAKLSDTDQRQLLARYGAWVGQLKESGSFVSGDAIGGGGKWIRSEQGRVVVEDYTEKKKVLTGYFIIDAVDWDAAVEIAKGCPALTHGESVELRSVGH